jgi:hypothetical protein
MDELKKQRGVLEKTIDVNNKKIANMKAEARAAVAEAKATKAKLPKAGQIFDAKTQSWIDPPKATKPLGGRAGIVEGKVPPVPVGAVDEIVKAPGWFKNILKTVTDSKIWKGAKGIGSIGLKVADTIVTKILTPLEAIRGAKAGWEASEGQDWDMRLSASLKGMTANVADLLFTDTLRGAEAISGMAQDWWNDRALGTTVADYGAKDLKAFFEKEVGAFKEGSTLEGMLERGDITWWDLIGLGEKGEEGKVWGKEGKAWSLEMETERGRLQTMFAERKEQRRKQALGKYDKQGKRRLGTEEELNLFLVDVGSTVAGVFNEITKQTDADKVGRLTAQGRGNTNTITTVNKATQNITAVTRQRDGNHPLLRFR